MTQQTQDVWHIFCESYGIYSDQPVTDAQIKLVNKLEKYFTTGKFDKKVFEQPSPTSTAPIPVAKPAVDPSKPRGRGRPPGAKNKLGRG